jgi:hypothetical protein
MANEGEMLLRGLTSGFSQGMNLGVAALQLDEKRKIQENAREATALGKFSEIVKDNSIPSNIKANAWNSMSQILSKIGGVTIPQLSTEDFDQPWVKGLQKDLVGVVNGLKEGKLNIADVQLGLADVYTKYVGQPGFDKVFGDINGFLEKYNTNLTNHQSAKVSNIYSKFLASRGTKQEEGLQGLVPKGQEQASPLSETDLNTLAFIKENNPVAFEKGVLGAIDTMKKGREAQGRENNPNEWSVRMRAAEGDPVAQRAVQGKQTEEARLRSISNAPTEVRKTVFLEAPDGSQVSVLDKPGEVNAYLQKGYKRLKETDPLSAEIAARMRGKTVDANVNSGEKFNLFGTNVNAKASPKETFEQYFNRLKDLPQNKGAKKEDFMKAYEKRYGVKTQ